jgi:hypothetical protein
MSTMENLQFIISVGCSRADSSRKTNFEIVLEKNRAPSES